MTRTRDDERIGREDAALVERMREGFGPAPLDPARAAAFDARLRERIEAPTRRPWAWAALTAATAAALAWAVLPGAPVAPEPVETAGAERLMETLAWEQEVLFGDAFDEPFADEDGDLLPPDYLALASAFDF